MSVTLKLCNSMSHKKEKEKEKEHSPSAAHSLTWTHPGEAMMHMISEQSEKPILFDVAWEVCRKVGGIYTVLTTKALVTVQEWHDRYALIGPYHAPSAATEFEPIRPSPFAEAVIEKLQDEHGLKVHFGRWLIAGYPRVFLIELDSGFKHLGKWRHELMAGFERPEDGECNDYIVFGYCVSLLLKAIRDMSPESRPILAHFHEWQAGVGLIVLKRWGIKIGSLFTTHATLLGRYLAAGNVDLYGKLGYIEPDKEAGDRQIYHRHWIEVGAARGADVFTTVSDITGFEAEYLLGRKPDVITPNGLNIERFAAVHEFQNLHKQYKDVINEFVRGHFYGHLDWNLDKTVYFFTAGRHEYHNKGVDLFLEALAELNYQLKRDGSDVTVVAFIIMPGKTNNYNVESIKGQSVRREIRETCDRIVKDISERLYENIISGKMPKAEDLLVQQDLVDIKRRVFAIQGHGRIGMLPPIVTHNMVDADKDEILQHIRRTGLLNQSDQRVKIVYHSEFLNSTSPIFPIDYHQFVRGCHLGVFPSYYEPWGYTPAECTIMGVPSITSNLTGFANFISRRVSDPEANGLFIIDRRFKAFEEGKNQMASIMYRYCALTRRQRIQLRNKTERLSSILSWNSLGKQYVKARNEALKRVFNTTMGMPDFFDDESANSLLI